MFTLFHSKKYILSVLLAAIVAWLLVTRFDDPKPYRAQINIMGTLAHVVIVPDRNLKGRVEDAAEVAFAAMRKVDELMSNYKPDSEISRLNRLGVNKMLEVNPWTMEVLLAARYFNRISAKAFDITIPPILTLYNYNNSQVKALPKQKDITNALAFVGTKYLHLEPDLNQVEFTAKGMSVDLGAIAKGFAVDKAALALQGRGVKNALIEIGGELRLLGQANDKQGKKRLWRIGIRHPRRVRELIDRDERTNCAVATSGDYMKFFEIVGKRYSHIVDPRTGYPVVGGVVSVTIIHPDSCMYADAIATSISVLGLEKSRQFIQQFPGSEAIIYSLDKDGKVSQNPLHIIVKNKTAD